MKITGYTILGFIILCLLLYGLISFEIFLYEDYIKDKNPSDLVGCNIFIGIVILFILGVTGCLDKLHELLKKRIL